MFLIIRLVLVGVLLLLVGCSPSAEQSAEWNNATDVEDSVEARGESDPSVKDKAINPVRSAGTSDKLANLPIPFEIHYQIKYQDGHTEIRSRTYFRGSIALAKLRRGDALVSVLFNLEDASFRDIQSGQHFSLSECEQRLEPALEKYRDALLSIPDRNERGFMRMVIEPRIIVDGENSDLRIVNGPYTYTTTGRLDLDHEQEKRWSLCCRLTYHRNWIIDDVNPPMLDFGVLDQLETRKMFPAEYLFEYPNPSGETTIVENTYSVQPPSDELSLELDEALSKVGK